MKTSWKIRLALICAAGFFVRIGYVLVALRDRLLLADDLVYSMQSVALADGRGFVNPFPFSQARPIADHPPLTALLLTPVTWLSRDSALAQRIFVAACGVGVVALIALIARRISGDRGGLIAAGIAAAYPGLWINDGLIMSETFAAATTAVALLVAYQAMAKPTLRSAALLGLACGIGALARSNLALLLPCVAIPTLLSLRSLSRTRRLVLIGSAGLAALAAVAPWVGPNLFRFDKPVLLATGDGITVLGSNCNTTYYASEVGSWSRDCAYENRMERFDESVDAIEARKQGVRYARDHAERVPLVIAARLGRTWGFFHPFGDLAEPTCTYRGGAVESQETNVAEECLKGGGRFRSGGIDWLEGRRNGLAHLGFALFVMIVPLAAWGTVVLRRNGTSVSPLLGILTLVTITTAMTYGLTRFRVPGEVVLVVLAAVAVDHLVAGRSRSPAASEIAS